MKMMMSRFRNNLKKAGFILAAVIFAAVPATALADQEKTSESVYMTEEEASPIYGPVSFDVTYGVNDTGKGGRYVPVNVIIDNTQEQPFQGTVTVTTMEADYQVYSYEYPAAVNAKEKLSTQYMIPFGNGSDQVFVSLYDGQNKQIGTKRLKMNVSKEVPELFIGALCDTPEALQYLDGVGVNYSALKTKLLPMETESFPNTTKGLDMLDVLIVTNYRLRDLTEQQTKAIMDWVRDGGVLIMGTGERVEDTLGRFAPELLDDNYGAPQMMEVQMKEDSEENVADSILNITCVEIPMHGSSILMADEGFPLFQSAPKEKGIIAVAAFDFTDISSYGEEEPSFVDSLFTNLLGEDRLLQLTDYFYGGSSQEFWSVQEVINSGNVSRLPKVSVYLMIIILYIFLAGPGLYWFLRKREKRQYYWGGVILLVLNFTALIYVMGIGTRFRRTFLTYATIMDVSEDTIVDNSYMNVRNPYSRPYEVEFVPDYSVRPITRSARYDYMSIPQFTEHATEKMRIQNQPDKLKISFQDAVAFEPHYFQLRKSYENTESAGITGEIQYFDGKVTGTITNQFNFRLEDVAVLLFGHLIVVGELDAGESIQLSDYPVYNTPLGNSHITAAAATGLTEYEKADIQNKDYLKSVERTNLLAFYMDNSLESYRREARVIGFNQDTGRQFIGEKEYEAYGLTMFTSAIEVYNDNMDEDVYRSGIMKKPVALKGSYDSTRNSTYGTDSVTLEYSLGNDLEVEEITFQQVSPELWGSELLGAVRLFQGAMYFYNYNTGSYDKMDQDKVSFTVDELKPYLSPGNTLNVKYICAQAIESNWELVLPMPMVTGREK